MTEIKYWSLRWTDKGRKEKRSQYDCSIEFVIAAATEAIAREIASDNSGDEGRRFWLDPILTTCEPYEFPKETGIVFFVEK